MENDRLKMRSSVPDGLFLTEQIPDIVDYEFRASRKCGRPAKNLLRPNYLLAYNFVRTFFRSYEKGMNSSSQQFLASSKARGPDHYGPVTSRVKTEAVLRLLKGESVEAVSQDLGITVSRIERWKDRFVESGSAELARRKSDSSKSWLGKHSGSIRQWIWLLLALVGLISILAGVMQRSARD